MTVEPLVAFALTGLIYLTVTALVVWKGNEEERIGKLKRAAAHKSQTRRVLGSRPMISSCSQIRPNERRGA